MNQPTATERSAVPWYRQPWPWLLIAIPATTVVAGLATLAIAIHTDDAVVADDFRREGLAIYRDPRRDAAAQALGISALLVHDEKAGQVTAQLVGRIEKAPSRLVLILSHATRAKHDQMIYLERSGAIYQAALGQLPQGHWTLELGPQDRSWRLRGEFQERISRLVLQPSTPG